MRGKGKRRKRERSERSEKQGSEEDIIQLPSRVWTSLQIAAACIFLSLVVMVENCDMAAPGESCGGEAKSHRRQRTSAQPVKMYDTKAKTTQRHMLAIDCGVKHPHFTQRPTEADRIYWGSEKGKVSTSL